MKRTITILSLIIVILSGCEQSDTVTEYTSDPQTNLDALWKILDEHYCYFTAKNIDWHEVHDIYTAKLRKYHTISIYDFFDLLASMIDTLQDGHVNLYSPFDISSCSGWYSSYPADFYPSVIYSSRYLGTEYRIAGGFQYGYLKNTNIGYIQYGSFSSGFSASNMIYIDNYFKNADGIIIDVRNNGGGSIEISKHLASCFFKEKTITGYIRHKTGTGHDDFSEPEPIYTDNAYAPIDWSDRKTIVLTNRMCYSATNDFIVRMHKAPNVTVIGGITGGGGGMPLSQELPNGWMIRFSAVPMFDADMQHTEFGVNPDIEVHITDSMATSGIDPILDSAIQILQ